MAKDKLVVLADSLEEVMQEAETAKAALDEIKEKEEALRLDLMQGLGKKGFDMIRTTSGMVLVLVKGRVAYKVKAGREQEAIDYMKENYPAVLSIAAAKVNKVLQPMLELPEMFERVQGDPHLSVRTENL